MTPQVKQRIEQIRRGEVPEGYKRTKAGVVPIEWEEVRIGDVLTQRKTLQCVSEDAPLLSFTIEEGVIDPADKKSNKRDFLIKDMATKKFALTEVGDIIYNPANLKFGAIHRNNLRRGVVSPIYGIFHGEQDSVFMGYLLHNQRFIDYAKVYTEGTVEKLKTLKADTFLKLKITLPSLPEQKKIAEILSAQDKLIALKEKLIEEKMKQKKALMQQLLTGKKRLPGFSGEWISFSISEVVLHITTGLNPRDNFRFNEKGECFYVTIKNFHDGCIFLDERCDKITQHDRELIHTRSKIDKGDILFASIGRVGDTYLIKEAPTEWDINESVFAIRANTNKVYSELLNYVLSSPFSKKKFISKVTGSTFQSIKINDLLKHKIKIPLSFDEQRQLIEFFDIIEKEVILLQKELDQEKQKKKALMQLLLTGIVRL